MNFTRILFQLIIAIVASNILQAENEMKPCMIAAHRGVTDDCPENTLCAIKEAITLQCDYVEIDVRTTKDGHLILMHDSNAKRTTGMDAPVQELLLEQVRHINTIKQFDSYYREEPIPTLEEALKTSKGKIQIYLDNKDTDPQQLVSILQKMEMLDDTVIYGSVDELEVIHRIEPTVRLMPGLSRIEDMEAILKRFEPYAFDVRWESLSPELINECHLRKIKVFADGFGENESILEYSKAIELGIDLIQTDNPSLLQRAIDIARY